MLRLSYQSLLVFILLVRCQTSEKSMTTGDEATAFTNVNVVTMENSVVLKNRTVLIKGDRIVKLGTIKSIDLPKNVRIINGEGKYLMPGLADMHVHVHDANDMLLFVANGITTVRNMSGEPKHLELREKVKNKEIIGPTMYTSGPVIDGDADRWEGSAKPPLMSNDWAQYQVVTNEQEVEMVIVEQKQLGYDFLKIYDNLSEEEYDAIGKIAKREGMEITGHVPFGVDIMKALAWHTSIEHFSGYLYKLSENIQEADFGWDKYTRLAGWNLVEVNDGLFPELIKETLTSSAWHCPTLSRYIKSMSPTSEHLDRLKLPGMKYFSTSRIEREKNRNQRSAYENFSEDDYKIAKQGYEKKKQFVGWMHQQGAKILIGTDDWFVGFATHRELAEFVDCGFTPYEALKAATADAAEFLNAKEEFGTITEGKRADLILLYANPLDDIQNAQKRVGVMIGGIWYSENDLLDLISPLATLH